MALDLKQQIGPLPLGAWIVVVGGGLGIAYYTKNAKVSAPTIVEDTGMPAGVGEGVGWIAVPPPSTAPPGPANPTTNEEWARLAINWLIAQGYPPGMSDSAIRNYLELQPLGNQEYALVQAALKQLGSPPIPLPAPPGAPTINLSPIVAPRPAVAPTGSSPAMRYQTVTPWPTSTSTLWGIARKYYGNGQRWSEIYNANRVGVTRPDGSKGWITNPSLLYAGRTVWVP